MWIKGIWKLMSHDNTASYASFFLTYDICHFSSIVALVEHNFCRRLRLALPITTFWYCCFIYLFIYLCILICDMTKRIRIRIRKRINVSIDEGKIFMPPTLNLISSFFHFISVNVLLFLFLFLFLCCSLLTYRNKDRWKRVFYYDIYCSLLLSLLLQFILVISLEIKEKKNKRKRRKKRMRIVWVKWEAISSKPSGDDERRYIQFKMWNKITTSFFLLFLVYVCTYFLIQHTLDGAVFLVGMSEWLVRRVADWLGGWLADGREADLLISNVLIAWYDEKIASRKARKIWGCFFQIWGYFFQIWG